jgi:hypothetical protein
MLYRVALFVLAFFSCINIGTTAFAEANPSIRAVIDGIEDEEDIKKSPKLLISNMSVNIRIHGRMAETVIEATITNPSDDTVEARFSLVMPDDAVVTGYALDIGGKLIDGVLVDQPKAKSVYEDEIRKGIDPGLAEVTSGNIFKTRIYPISEKGSRTIKVRFVTPIDLAKGLILPLETRSPIGRFSLTVEASGLKAAPFIDLPNGGIMKLVKQSGVWRSEASIANNVKLNGALKIAGGEAAGQMLISDHDNGRSFFQIADFDAKRRAPPIKINHVRIYWDSSLSRRDDLLDEETALLADLIEQSGAKTIDVVRFTSSKPSTNSFTSKEAVVTHLKGSVYRGGTSFEGLDKLKLADADICLLFSDGVPTVDAESDFKPDCALTVISSAGDANTVRLGRLARASHGQFLKLDKSNRVELAARLQKAGISVVGAYDESGQKLPFRSLSAPDGSWFIVGRAPASGEVSLTIAGLGRGLAQRLYSLNSDAVGKSNAPGALWAAQEVEQLADNPTKREAMGDLSKSFSVASPSVAFLVLERPDQYLNADIKPPKDFDAEWMADYREQKNERDENKKEQKVERLNFVREQWAERKKWWDTKFEAPKPGKKSKNRRQQEEAVGDYAGASADASAPPPAYAPSSSRGADAGGFEEGDNIIVTASRRNDSLQEVAVSVSAISGKDAQGNLVQMEIADVLSDQPYLKALDTAAVSDRQKTLAEQEKTFGSLPAFYFDTAEWFRLKDDIAISEELLLSALELPSADDETRLIVSFRLQRSGQYDDAIRMLELMAVKSDFRPQPRRSLALALVARGKAKGTAGLPDLERAFKLLTDVVLKPGQSDFDGIEIIALMEANALIPLIEASGGTWELDKQLLGTLDTDVRIIIEWTNDDADIDLWVIEPTGEKTFYGNKQSQIGGTISNDMTNGYGPEEYVIHRAITGEYVIKIDGYSPDRLNPNGKGRVMVRLIRNFARKTEKEELIDAELSFNKDDEDKDGGRRIAKMKVGPAKQ